MVDRSGPPADGAPGLASAAAGQVGPGGQAATEYRAVRSELFPANLLYRALRTLNSFPQIIISDPFKNSGGAISQASFSNPLFTDAETSRW
jgi:DNA modification methylase